MRDSRSQFIANAVKFSGPSLAILALGSWMVLCSSMAVGQQSQGAQSNAGQDQAGPRSSQQQKLVYGLPARAPGYELYYGNENHNLAFATRWGYFDGWRDGKHDSELGISKPPVDQDRYKLVPDHGLHPDIPRSEYKTAYRTAYLHGYDNASKAVNGVMNVGRDKSN